MRAREFLIEYNRNTMVRMMGKQLLKSFAQGNDIRLANQPQFRTPENTYDTNKMVDFVLATLEQADPTPTKVYTPWLAREYVKQNIKRLEDASAHATPALSLYDTYKRSGAFPAEYKDIMRISYNQLLNFIRSYDAPPTELKDKGRSTQVYSDSEVRVIVPEDQTAACYYGQGTRWCTAATRGTNYFNQYSRQGKLYILLPTNPRDEGEKYQLHFESDQFMDKEDDPVDIGWMLRTRFPSLLPFFLKNEPELKTFVVFSDNAILEKVGKQIHDLAMERVNEIVMDWETDDESFRDWQTEQAIDKGYVDEEGNIDWDLVYEDDSINNYSDYNYEVKDFYKQMDRALSVSPAEMRDMAAGVEQYLDNGPLKITELDSIYETELEETFGRTRGGSSNDYGIGDWIMEHLEVKKDGTVKYWPGSKHTLS
jgi:hypothetical protein